MKYFFFSILMLVNFSNLFGQKDFDWETYFEKSGYISTPNYYETINYFNQLADYSDKARFVVNYQSPQGRDMGFLVVSASGNISPEFRSKPLVLIINGIHSGEIEGKDASMMLLREILITKEIEHLLDSINIIVVPIFNIDGHERKSKYNRINQNGPEEMGWRTTAQNLNLNRDWMKADAPEMKWMLMLLKQYQPDFIIDTHTTDGADYQYSVTYSVEWSRNIYKQTGIWLRNNFVPYLEKSVEENGFLIFPYIYLKNWDKGVDEGLIYWPATPRFSTGYCALQNRPSLLVETHMIKPYKERVFATKVVLQTSLDFVYQNASALLKLNKEADEQTIIEVADNQGYLPLAYDNSDKYVDLNFKGFEYYWEPSSVSGVQKLIYTDKDKDFLIKYYTDIIVTDSIKIPEGYLIPLEWNELHFNMITFHGIESELRAAGEELNVERYQFSNVKFDSASYEGRQRVNFDYFTTKEKIILEKDMIYIPSAQRTLRVIVNLLEPGSADSYIRWGFMNQIFEQKEYYEDYVMEKLAEDMLSNDPELKKEFEAKLEIDESFRNNPRARLDFFYERSPYVDKQRNVYPILRVME